MRLTLGCLLGLELRRIGSGKRLTFGKGGEATLSQWMAENPRVGWLEHAEPWALESELISQLNLPLNLDQDRRNAFYDRLKELRAQARHQARVLPISAKPVALTSPAGIRRNLPERCSEVSRRSG